MADLLHPLKIGNVTLPNNLVLSPMAGYSDVAFRALCRRYGAGLVCTEMVAAPSMNHGDRTARRKAATRAEERPVSIQVFGNDPAAVRDAARRVAPSCDIVGFNFGCPAPQIKQAGCGAALLDHPELAVRLVEALRAATEKPLLIKMRTGNTRRLDVAAFGRRLEEAGADAFILHGRTAADMYSGRADWSAVRQLKDAVGVPVIGNGDIVDGPSARRALEESGADGVALGRAALGNPRVFSAVAHHMATGEETGPAGFATRIEDFETYAAQAAAAGLPLQQIRNQALRFAKGFPGARDLRVRLHGTPDLEAILDVVRGAAA